jgi:hypothetical protein
MAATLALLFSMTGGALAAKHYLVNSTKQINPKVLRALKASKGPTGPSGPQGKEGSAGKGAEGSAGKSGATGAEGPAGKVGATGQEGPTGKEGAPGATKIVTRYGPIAELEKGASFESYAACLAGEGVTGGGYDFTERTPSSAGFRLAAARPSIAVVGLAMVLDYPPPENGGVATGWVVKMENDTDPTFDFRAYVQCASP